MKKRALTILGINLLFLFLVSIFSTVIGTANITPQQIFQVLLGRFFSSDVASTITRTQEMIILQVRLPRIMAGLLVGASLSLSGTAYQGLFKNPMADPFILGISAGAGLGATITLILRSRIALGLWATPLLAFTGGLLTTILVFSLSRQGNKVPVTTLLLAGIATSSFLSALTSFLMVVYSQDLHQIFFWLMGGLGNRTWAQIGSVLPYILTGSLMLIWYSRDLNVLLMGEETAHHLGIHVEKLKIIILAAASMITAAAVSISGIIGFVGLIIPHIMRLLIGPDHRLLYPASALFGGSFLILTDTLARTLIAPAEIPVGIITAFFGAPFFIYLLKKKKKTIF